MKKETYTSPEIEIILLNVDDIITTSFEDEGEGEI